MKTKKKYEDGGMTGFEKRQAKKLGRAQTRAAIAGIEGEGTVAQKRDNRATRVATMAGTGRAKTPKSVSTSTSTTDNRNSGNTTNTTNSGSSSGAMGGSGGRSGSTSGVDNSKKSSTSVNQSQDNSRTNNVKNTSNTNVRQSQNNSKNTTVNQSQNNSRNSSKSTTNYTDKSNTTKIDQSRKNTQIGKGNTSTKNSNFKKGGAVKKYQDGGYIRVKGKTGAKDSITKSRTTMSGGTKTKTISGGPMVPNAVGKVTKTKTNADGTLNRSSVKSISGDRAMNKISKYKTGGMVNSNAKVSASKVARGKVGGISSAPKTAVPKAKYGMVMRKK